MNYDDYVDFYNLEIGKDSWIEFAMDILEMPYLTALREVNNVEF